MSGRYHFGYEPGSLYERLVQLVDRHRPAAGQVVVDLGCGYGAIAEPLRDLGLRYVGIDGDPDAVDDLRRRGFAADCARLGDVDNLTRTFEGLVGDQRLAAVVMADVIEHLTNAEEVLGVVHRQILGTPHRPHVSGEAPLVVSIPNVSHIDLAAKLLTGRWDVSPTGLLDATHVGFYTPGRLEQVMTGLGWEELERADWELVHSDQHFPEDLAVLAPGSPLHELLHQVRTQCAPGAETNQFVRAYRAVPMPVDPASPHGGEPAGEARADNRVERQAPADASDSGPRTPDVFLSVVVPVRSTAADDPSHDTVLTDALASLAGQSDQDFEVLLVPSGSGEDRPTREDRLALFIGDLPEHLARRTRVLHVPAPSSSEPRCHRTADALAAGLASASGRWVVVLDGAVAFAHWVEVFHQLARGAPGKVLHASVAVQRGHSTTWSSATGGVPGFDPVTWPEPEQLPGVDWLSWLWAEAGTELPAGCGFAVPRQSGFDLATLARTDMPAEPGVDTPADADRDPGADTPAGTLADAGSDPGADTPADSDTPADAGCDPGADTPADADRDPADADRDPAGTGTGVEPGAPGNPRAGLDPFAVAALRLASLAGLASSTQVTSVRRYLSPSVRSEHTTGVIPAGGEQPASAVGASDPLSTWLCNSWLPVGPAELRRIQAAGHEVGDLRRSVAAHREALAATEAALADARRELGALRASTSWVVTAPLRMLTEAARRRTRS